MKIFIALALIVAISANLHLNVKYRSFVQGSASFDELVIKEIYSQFRSPFTTKSEQRFIIFRQNLIEIRNHNVGQHTWTQGINDFADMTFEEFTAGRLMAPQ